jgi:hypothetical protein
VWSSQTTSKELTVNLKRYQVILAIIGIIIAMGIVGQSDFEEEQRQADQYCEMVKLWKETRGQAGWPAYDGERMCR